MLTIVAGNEIGMTSATTWLNITLSLLFHGGVWFLCVSFSVKYKIVVWSSTDDMACRYSAGSGSDACRLSSVSSHGRNARMLVALAIVNSKTHNSYLYFGANNFQCFIQTQTHNRISKKREHWKVLSPVVCQWFLQFIYTCKFQCFTVLYMCMMYTGDGQRTCEWGNLLLVYFGWWLSLCYLHLKQIPSLTLHWIQRWT